MCGCGGVINQKKLSPSKGSYNTCIHLYDEMLSLIYKSSQVLNKEYTELMADSKQQVYDWLIDSENNCPDEGEYETIKSYIESEYTEHFT
jgi:hypothetical protein